MRFRTSRTTRLNQRRGIKHTPVVVVETSGMFADLEERTAPVDNGMVVSGLWNGDVRFASSAHAIFL